MIATGRRSFLQQCSSLVITAALGILRSSQVLAADLERGLQGITGRVIDKTDPAYRSWWASMCWYIFKPKRYPDLIVQVKNEAGIIDAINHARQNELKIAVRASGHNPARAVLRDGGMLLDLSPLQAVDVDPHTQTAWVQPGVRSEELLAHTTRHQLVFPAAHTGIVGLGGYLLGGGIGWNMGEYGIACRSILAAEMITSAGEKILVSEDDHQELLWAIRGAGPGFFGAVARYKLQLYPLHTAIRLNSYVIPVAKLAEAVRIFREIADIQDRRLEILIKVGRFYPAEKPYTERDLVCTVGFFAFADTDAEAKAIMQPVVAGKIGALSLHTREKIPLSYADLYRPPETDYSSPNRTAVHNSWTDDPGEFLLKLTEKMQQQPPPSPRSFLLSAWSFNSTFNDPGSCVRTDARHYMSWYMIAETEADIAPNYQWMDESVELTRPLSKGHYINEIDPLRYPHQLRECFSPASWNRLAELRHKYDPAGVFHTYLGQH